MQTISEYRPTCEIEDLVWQRKRTLDAVNVTELRTHRTRLHKASAGA
jgi:hypothetical protein